jgi:hypothetical protein
VSFPARCGFQARHAAAFQCISDTFLDSLASAWQWRFDDQ